MRENPTEIQIPGNALGLLSRQSTVEKLLGFEEEQRSLLFQKGDSELI